MNDSGSSNIEQRVLVLPSTTKDFELTRDILERAGIECVVCVGLDDLNKKVREGAGALLIVEEVLAGAEDQQLARYVEEQPSWSDLPLLVLARTGADSTRIAAAMDRLGNVTVLERPL